MSIAHQVVHEYPTIESRFDTNDIVWSKKVSGRKPRLLFLITEDWYFRSHRLDLAREAHKAGMEVFVSTFAEDGGKWIKDEGFTYLPIPFLKGSRNPFRDLYAVFRLTQLYRQVRPDIVHQVAMKPILYGSLAARAAKVPCVVNAFGGLGYFFGTGGAAGRVLRMGMKAILRLALAIPNSRTIVQTQSDRNCLNREGIARQNRTVVIRGVGADMTMFTPQWEAPQDPVILHASRMIWSKGVGDFVEAAKLSKQQGVNARFVLVGRTDPAAPQAISEPQLLAWQKEGVVEWWGHRDDMPNVIGRTWMVVLPTFYGEGIPKILIEACACGKPVITTPISGCSDIIRDGENGFVVPQKDPRALAKAIQVLVENPVLRRRMGMRGREIVVDEFTSQRMARQTLAVYQELLENC
jgi:glycosyltransferase involved in cell wall biosynthesis